MIGIGERIASGRKAAGLTQAELAERLSISKQAVGKWERDESTPDIFMLEQLALIFGTDLNYFSGLSAAATADDLPKDAPKNMGMTIWKGADFSQLKNTGGQMSFSNIEQCKFCGADLSRDNFRCGNLRGNDFSGANLSEGKFSSTNIKENDFSGANLGGILASRSNVESNSFFDADLSKAVFRACSFVKNDLNGANLSEVQFSKCGLRKIIFSGQIAGCSFSDCTFAGVKFVDATLTEVFFKGRNMRKVKFENCVADKLTYEFLKNAGADVSSVTVLSSPK